MWSADDSSPCASSSSPLMYVFRFEPESKTQRHMSRWGNNKDGSEQSQNHTYAHHTQTFSPPQKKSKELMGDRSRWRTTDIHERGNHNKSPTSTDAGNFAVDCLPHSLVHNICLHIVVPVLHRQATQLAMRGVVGARPRARKRSSARFCNIGLVSPLEEQHDIRQARAERHLAQNNCPKSADEPSITHSHGKDDGRTVLRRPQKYPLHPQPAVKKSPPRFRHQCQRQKEHRLSSAPLKGQRTKKGKGGCK
jgi:hypothetical protein